MDARGPQGLQARFTAQGLGPLQAVPMAISDPTMARETWRLRSRLRGSVPAVGWMDSDV